MLKKLSPQDLSEIRNIYADLINYSSKNVAEPIDPLTYVNSEGDSLLHIAVLRGDERTVRLLLEAGVDPNILGDLGSTPLHYVDWNSGTKIVRLLLDHGANKDIVDKLGNRPND